MVAEALLTPRQLDELATITARKVVEMMSEKGGGPMLLDSHELAGRLGVSVSTIERKVKAGEIPSRRIGTRRKFLLAEVLDSLESCDANSN